MDALDTRLRRHPAVGHPAPPEDAVARAEALVSQLPVLVRGGWTPAVPLDAADALLRIQTGIWAVAARERALSPEAREAAQLLAAVLVGERRAAVAALQAAARLIAYLELRARFG